MRVLVWFVHILGWPFRFMGYNLAVGWYQYRPPSKTQLRNKIIESFREHEHVLKGKQPANMPHVSDDHPYVPVDSPPIVSRIKPRHASGPKLDSNKLRGIRPKPKPMKARVIREDDPTGGRR